MQPLILDTEWTMGTGYSLRQVSYSEYIKDPRVEPVLATWTANGEVRWSTDFNDIPQPIDLMVCHNTMFDAFMLKHRFGITAKHYFCTMQGARPLCPEIPLDLNTLARALGVPGKKDQKALHNTYNMTRREILDSSLFDDYLAYGIQDTKATWDIFNIIYPELPDREKALLDLTIQIWLNETLRLDIPLLRKIRKQELADKETLFNKVGLPRETFSSVAKFVTVLKDLGIEVPTKESPATGNPIPALAQGDYEYLRLRAKHPEHQDLWDAHKAANSSIVESRCDRLIKASIDGKIPAGYKYAAAHTLRWGGLNKVNLQNLPRTDESNAGQIRSAICAPPGHVLVVADLSQIERRVLDQLSHNERNLEVFRTGGDIYIEYASRIPSDERNLGKVLALSTMYGLGWEALMTKMAIGIMGVQRQITPEQARTFINAARDKPLTEFWNAMNLGIRAMHSGKPYIVSNIIEFRKDRVELPTGVPQYYPGLCMDIDGREWKWGPRRSKKIYHGLLTENIVQRLARDIIADHILEMSKRGFQIAMMTHDEVVIVCKEHEADQVQQQALDILRTPPTWLPDIPLDAKADYDYRYCK